MWPFSSLTPEEKLKERLLDLKKIKVGGMKFTIKKINPLLDFPSDKIPQIFTDYYARRQNPKDFSQEDLERLDENIKPILKAGIYKPDIIPIDKENRWKEKGLTIEDLFIDRELAYTLFGAILNHSLVQFKGFEKVFFSIRQKLMQLTAWLRGIQLALYR